MAANVQYSTNLRDVFFKIRYYKRSGCNNGPIQSICKLLVYQSSLIKISNIIYLKRHQTEWMAYLMLSDCLMCAQMMDDIRVI